MGEDAKARPVVPQKRSADEEQAEAKPKRQRLPHEILHAECYAECKKFFNTSTRASSICDQAALPENDWHWANNECESLRKALTSTEDFLKDANADVLTKKLYKLLLDKGGEEETIKFLTKMKHQAEANCKVVATFLVPLTKMHSFKFMPLPHAKAKSKGQGSKAKSKGK